MANALSIASGVAGLISLSSNVVVAGYKYVDSISSAPEDLKSLLRETASLSAVLSQLMAHCMSDDGMQQIADYKPAQQNVFQECEHALQGVQSLLRDCELVSMRHGKNAVTTLLWPHKQKETVKSRDCLNRLCASLHTAIAIKSATTLRILEREQKRSNEVVKKLEHTARNVEERKILDWLSTLDETVKHTNTKVLKQSGTYEWFLKEQRVLNWLDTGTLLWLNGASGAGKTVLV